MKPTDVYRVTKLEQETKGYGESKADIGVKVTARKSEEGGRLPPHPGRTLRPPTGHICDRSGHHA